MSPLLSTTFPFIGGVKLYSLLRRNRGAMQHLIGRNLDLRCERRRGIHKAIVHVETPLCYLVRYSRIRV